MIGINKKYKATKSEVVDGKEQITLEELAPPQPPAPTATKRVETKTPDPIVGQYMSFERLSAHELREYYERVHENPFSSRKKQLDARVYDKTLGRHRESPLDETLPSQDAILRYYKESVRADEVESEKE